MGLTGVVSGLTHRVAPFRHAPSTVSPLAAVTASACVCAQFHGFKAGRIRGCLDQIRISKTFYKVIISQLKLLSNSYFKINKIKENNVIELFVVDAITFCPNRGEGVCSFPISIYRNGTIESLLFGTYTPPDSLKPDNIIDNIPIIESSIEPDSLIDSRFFNSDSSSSR